MMLYEQMMTTATLWEQRRVSDGEGGFATIWAAGAAFECVCVCNSTNEERKAEQAQAADSWTVTTLAELKYGDVFVRDNDNKAFKVTSNGCEGVTPEVATFQFKQYAACDYDLKATGDED